MLLLERPATTPAHDLALDEALLESAEAKELDTEVLRLWDANAPQIILGRSGKVQEELNVDLARCDGVPILRRASGGGTVFVAPGCSFFSLLLSIRRRPELQMIDRAHQFVMENLVDALQPLMPGLEFHGTCDLSLDGRKVSGNSLRVKRDWLLYHGTLLLDMDLSLVDRYLKHPPREPAYRKGRPHHEFIANLNLPTGQVSQRIAQQFNAHSPLQCVPIDRANLLVAQKYALDTWNLSR